MSVSNAVKQRVIGELIKTPQGRAKLAASMTQPLRLRRDYASVGRKTFLVEQLPDGALPIYDKDPDVTAFVVGEEGQNILAVTKPRRVIFPLFEIASNPEIPLTQIKERRFDLIERAQDLARAQVQAASAIAVCTQIPDSVLAGIASLAGGRFEHGEGRRCHSLNGHIRFVPRTGPRSDSGAGAHSTRCARSARRGGFPRGRCSFARVRRARSSS